MQFETNTVMSRMAMTDAITFDGAGRPLVQLSAVTFAETSDYQGGDPFSISGFNEIAKVIVSAGRYAVVRMQRGLQNKLSNVCKPVMVDIEQKLDFLEKLRHNLLTFAKWLDGAQAKALAEIRAAATEQDQEVIFKAFVFDVLDNMNRLTQSINDVAHARDLTVYRDNKVKLEGLPQQEYRIVETFYYNYQIFAAAFQRNVARYNHALEQKVVVINVMIDALLEIAQSAGAMIQATGDIFGKK